MENNVWKLAARAAFPPLRQDVTTDVCIVGAGIAGLSTAYYLLKKGRQVTIIDRHLFGDNETGASSGHLSSALDDGFQRLRGIHGEKGTQLAYQSHVRAIDEIERIVSDEKIDCGFRRVNGYLFLSPDKDESFLQDELRAAREAGAVAAEFLENSPLLNLGPCIKFPRQGKFHPLQYLTGLANAVTRLGGRIYAETAAMDIQGGVPALVTTDRQRTITAGAVVLATNVPINVHLRVQPKLSYHRTHVIAVPVPQGFLADSLLWDTADPYHYVRTTEGADLFHDLLLVGGADHRTGLDLGHDHFQQLADWTRGLLQSEVRIAARWSGQIVEPIDSLAFIGHSPGDGKNVYICTGDSGHGLTHGTIAGMLLSDLITGRENEWTGLYRPNRLSWKTQGAFVALNLSVAYQYTDWITAGQPETVESLARDSGAIIQDGMRKIAAYKDCDGCVHRFSPACTHLKGMVHWNDEEKTWDCPCHGSRFDKLGRVINGPAVFDLDPAEDATEAPLLPSPNQPGYTQPSPPPA